jgi:hypothetical protein
MSEFAATCIRVLHILFIAWVVYAPFSNNDEFLVLHAVVCPFLMLHWMTSSAGCVLTVLEKRLRGLDTDDESFMHKLVAPIYVIDDTTLRNVVFGATMGLWIITLMRLKKKYLDTV